MRRVLEEGAFWDIYYEHCSYFTLGSHARLFRRAGLDVTDLRSPMTTSTSSNMPDPPGRADLDAEDDLEECGPSPRPSPHGRRGPGRGPIS